MDYDNPAERLKAILQAGNEVSRSEPCRGTWEKLLDVPTGNNSLLFSRLGKVMELPQMVVGSLGTYYPHHLSIANLWREPIETAFINQELRANWDTFIRHINAHCIAALALVSDLLHNKISTKKLQETDIGKIEQQLKQLESLVNESTISERLKIYLLREIRFLSQAVSEYRICGSHPIIKQIESMCGHVVMDSEYSSLLKETDIGKTIRTTLATVADIVTITCGIPSISQSIAMLLLSNS